MLGMQSYLKVANQAKNDGTYIHGVYIILVILIAQKEKYKIKKPVAISFFKFVESS